MSCTRGVRMPSGRWSNRAPLDLAIRMERGLNHLSNLVAPLIVVLFTSLNQNVTTVPCTVAKAKALLEIAVRTVKYTLG